MAALLPMKETSREVVLEVSRALQPRFPEITAAWRQKMFAEFDFDGRAMAALERLTIGTGFSIFAHTDFATFFNNLQHLGERLAKLKVSARAVARSLEIYQQLMDPYLEKMFPPNRLPEAAAAMETLSWATYVAVSTAYSDAQKIDAETLLSVLDAELSAGNLNALLGRVLGIATYTFGANLGVILLKDAEQQVLRTQAHVGFAGNTDDLSRPIAIGEGFAGAIAQNGEPAIMADLRNPGHDSLDPFLQGKAEALWGAPLKSNDEVIGVLIIGFSTPQDWLPTERELLRAIADRSALAIDRAGMNDALREREMRIAELSGHLMHAQEEERKRISRELHDETGQALMVIRLYLGMLETSVGARSARMKIRETLAVVDRTIEGIRRIIGRLSPLVLQELGLIAAVRKEAKDLAKSSGVKARVSVSPDFGRLPAPVEAAIYRVVQEALHNVAKHANATTVSIEMGREAGCVRLLIEDDGVGIASAEPNPGRQTFGMAGMQERIGNIGGKMKVSSARGRGTRIEVSAPVLGDN
ncbi:MAG TPA: GAF domain-containing sensor histidine kinase, partial [Candidatus Binatia bacterium]|nr:GAF domain-containing sensor histidine kinase [Candidatus Binatia bacterium]